MGVIDFDSLIGGMEYFLQPILSFVLVGIVQCLCDELVLHRGSPDLLSAIIKSLILHESFPSMIFNIVGARLLTTIDGITEFAYENWVWEVKGKVQSVDPEAETKTHSSPTVDLTSNFEHNFEIVSSLSRMQDPFNQKVQFLDLNLYRNILFFHGSEIFVNLVIQNLFRHLSTENGLRAAELAALLLTTPLRDFPSENSPYHPSTQLFILFETVLPSTLQAEPERLKSSRFQRLFGWFVSLLTLLGWNYIKNNEQSLNSLRKLLKYKPRTNLKEFNFILSHFDQIKTLVDE